MNFLSCCLRDKNKQVNIKMYQYGNQAQEFNLESNWVEMGKGWFIMQIKVWKEPNKVFCIDLYIYIDVFFIAVFSTDFRSCKKHFDCMWKWNRCLNEKFVSDSFCFSQSLAQLSFRAYGHQPIDGKSKSAHAEF